MAAADIETEDVNFELETKTGGRMEDSVLAKAVIIKNRRKLRDYERETFQKMVDDVKATGSHIVPKLRGSDGAELLAAGLLDPGDNGEKPNTADI